MKNEDATPKHDWLLKPKSIPGLNIRVRIYANVATLMRAAHAYGLKTPRKSRWDGLYLSGPMQIVGTQLSDGALAHIFFAMDTMRVEVVAHEIEHAVLDLLFRKQYFAKIVRHIALHRQHKRTRWADNNEEALCHFAGEMNRLIWKNWYRYVRKEKT
jgi:hypothetical protein